MAKNLFTRIIQGRGWTLKEVAHRWGYRPQSVGRIAARPSQRDIDAARGLPKREGME